MNVSYLGFIERGDDMPTLIIVLQLAEALGVEPGTLLRNVADRR